MPYMFETSSFKRSPWKIYSHLRKNKPVFYSGPRKCFYVLSYPLVKNALVSPDLGVYHPVRLTHQLLGPTVLDSDGENHKRIKPLITELFKPSCVHQYRAAAIKPIINSVIENIKIKKIIDWVEVAKLVPSMIIAEFMGLPRKDGEWIYQTLGPIVRTLDTLDSPLQKGLLAKDEIEKYLDQNFSSKEKNTFYVKVFEIAKSRGVPLDHKEALDHALLLLVGGIETVVCAMCSLMHCLTQFPEYQKNLRSGQLTVEDFVKEVIRWESPLHFTLRFALKDTCITDMPVPKDSAIQLCIASANRDEDFFDDAENFNPSLNKKADLAFGMGAHACPGINFAKAELEMMLKEILEETAWISSLDGLVTYRGVSFRRPERFLIKIDAL